MTLYERFTQTAQLHRRRVAVATTSRLIKYCELHDMVDATAAKLASAGIKRGDSFGILLENCPEYIAAYFAVSALGAAVVPLNTMLKSMELAYILEDASVKSLMASPEFLEKASGAVSPDCKIILTRPGPEGTASLAQLPCSDNWRYEKVAPDAVAALLYTSGTTGVPKGVMLSHSNLISNVDSCLAAIPLRTEDNFLCILPMFHSFAFTVCVLVPLLSGATTTVLESVKPFKRVFMTILKRKVTIVVGVPALFAAMATAPRPGLLARLFFKLKSRARLCISGGDALPLNVLQLFENRFRVPLLEGYGLTEAAPVVSLSPLTGRKPGSVGVPLAGVSVKVVGEDGRELRPGVQGELCIRGPNVMKGYLNQPEETNRVLCENWLRTGDIAKLDHDGHISIVGRKKEFIIVRGMNVSPAEVERAMCAHPKVAECAVVGRKDALRGEVPVAFVKLKENEKWDEAELLNFCREKLADYKVPRKFFLRDSLPRTATGKIAKSTLKEEGSQTSSE